MELTPMDFIVEMQLAKPNYLFIKDGDAEDVAISIEECRLLVPKYTLNDKLFLSLTDKLAHQPMKKYYTKTQMATHSIPSGSRSAIIDSLTLGKKMT